MFLDAVRGKPTVRQMKYVEPGSLTEALQSAHSRMEWRRRGGLVLEKGDTKYPVTLRVNGESFELLNVINDLNDLNDLNRLLGKLRR